MTVEHILEELSAGTSTEQLLAAHPRLTKEAVSAALAFAARGDVRSAGIPEVSAELRDEFAAWDRASNRALKSVEGDADAEG